MAQNFLSEAEILQVTPAAAIASGSAVVVGSVLGVALTAISPTKQGSVKITGEFVLPKLSTAVISQGQSLHWSVSGGKFIVASPATGDLLNVAIATQAAGNGTTTVTAKLNPGCGSISP